MRQCVSGKCPSRWQTCIKPFASKTEVDEAIGLWSTSVSFEFTTLRLGLFPSKWVACFVSASYRERWICRWDRHFFSDSIRCVQKGSWNPPVLLVLIHSRGSAAVFQTATRWGYYSTDSDLFIHSENKESLLRTPPCGITSTNKAGLVQQSVWFWGEGRLSRRLYLGRHEQASYHRWVQQQSKLWFRWSPNRWVYWAWSIGKALPTGEQVILKQLHLHKVQPSSWMGTSRKLHHGVLLLTDLLLLYLVYHLQRSLTVGGWGIAGIPGKSLLLILGRVSTSIIITIDLGYLCIGLLVAMATMAKSKTASCYDLKKKCCTVMFEYGFSSILSTIITELKENCRFAKQGTCAQCGESPDGAHGRLSEEKSIKVRFRMILDYMGSELNKKNGTLFF